MKYILQCGILWFCIFNLFINIFFITYIVLIMNNLAVSSLKYPNLGSNITTRGQCTNLKVSTFSDPFSVALVDFLFSSGTRLSEKISFSTSLHPSFFLGRSREAKPNKPLCLLSKLARWGYRGKLIFIAFLLDCF